MTVAAQVLQIFPTTIRRRILRHLYLGHVRNAYLFKGVRQKFIDAVLSVSRIELFMPQVGWEIPLSSSVAAFEV